MINWKKTKFFRRHEFDSPDAPGSGEIMDEELVKRLDLMRMFYGQPIHISSGVRTKARNKKLGGVDDSEHLTGHAADIPVKDSRERYKLLTMAYIVGFRRIGTYNKHLHVGNDPNKPQEVIWHGTSKSIA